MTLRSLALEGRIHPDALLSRDELAEALPGGGDALDVFVDDLPSRRA